VGRYAHGDAHRHARTHALSGLTSLSATDELLSLLLTAWWCSGGSQQSGHTSQQGSWRLPSRDNEGPYHTCKHVVLPCFFQNTKVAEYPGQMPVLELCSVRALA
jgi:hypothetical protein